MSIWLSMSAGARRYVPVYRDRDPLVFSRLLTVCTMTQVERKENVIGWYHSHPGYACWLSGIDVNTQITNQKYQDPFVAVVVRTRFDHVFLSLLRPTRPIPSPQIDPNRTISAGKVDIGAFRTYPENYTPPNVSSGGSSGEAEYQSIPLSKIEDFGVHANQYYQLEIEVFKSKLDDELLGLLWNKYWVDTLSSSALISVSGSFVFLLKSVRVYCQNRAYAASQLSDLAQKLAKAQSGVSSSRAPVPSLPTGPAPPGGDAGAGKEKEKAGNILAKEEKKKEDSQLVKSVRDRWVTESVPAHMLIYLFPVRNCLQRRNTA